MTNSLDLRDNGLLSIELAKELTRVEVSVRKEYTDYVGELSKANKLSGLDWLVNVTCRNPYQTKIFDNFCKLKLLELCIERGIDFDEVLVTDQGMYDAVIDLFKNYDVLLTVKLIASKSNKSIFLFVRRIVVSLYIILISFMVPRFFVKQEKKVPSQSIIYLDTYIKASDFSREGIFIDNYYSGILDNVPKKMLPKIWYIPTIYSLITFSELKWIIEKSRKSRSNFMIMEEWLKFSDYIYAFYMSFFLPRKIKKIPLYRDINVANLIFQDLSLDMFSPGLIRTILIYKFIFRLKNNGVKIEKVVDWNENQVVDRALNLAIREFYPSTSIIGYQGYIVSEHYVSHSPAPYEIEAGTVPDRLCVVSSKLVERKKEFYKDQNISVAPAFRFQKIINHTVGEGIKKDLVLLALPYHLNISEMIIDVCFEWHQLHNVNFIVKMHPATTEESLLNKISNLNHDCFKFKTVPLCELFDHTSLMISSDSSACFEAVSHGVHVIIIGNRTGATSNPLASIVDSSYWDICYESSCMQEVFEKNTDHCSLDLASLLTPVTEDSVMEFLEYNL